MREGRTDETGGLHISASNSVGSKLRISNNSESLDGYSINLTQYNTISINISLDDPSRDLPAMQFGLVGDSYAKVNVNHYVTHVQDGRVTVDIPIKAFSSQEPLNGLKYIEFPIIQANEEVKFELQNISFLSDELSTFDWLSKYKTDLVLEPDEQLSIAWTGKEDDQMDYEKVEVYLNDSLITTISERPYSFKWQQETPGFYNFTLKGFLQDGTICSDSKLIQLIEQPLGLVPVRTNTTWNIYPNPGKGQVHIEFNKIANEVVKLQVYTTGGKLVLSKQSLTSSFYSGEVLDLEHLPPAIYLINITSPSFQGTKRFIKE
jgi:hypothetical protein